LQTLELHVTIFRFFRIFPELELQFFSSFSLVCEFNSVFSRERSSTGSNDCFVVVVLVLVVVVVVGIFIL
jgi:hypothetical protein